MPSRYKLSSQPGRLAIDQLGLPADLTVLFRERGISWADQLYAFMIGAPDLVQRIFFDYHVDFDAELRGIRERLPADLVAEVDAINERKVDHPMGVISQPRANGPLRVIRRSS
jgi:hypothetical protein